MNIWPAGWSPSALMSPTEAGATSVELVRVFIRKAGHRAIAAPAVCSSQGPHLKFCPWSKPSPKSVARKDKSLTQVWSKGTGGRGLLFAATLWRMPFFSTKLACSSETCNAQLSSASLIRLYAPMPTAKAQSAPNPEKSQEGLDVEPRACGRLLGEESKKEGAVALHVYRAYWKAVGPALALAILFSLLLMQGERMATHLLHYLRSCCSALRHLGLIIAKPRDSPRMSNSGTKGMPHPPILRESWGSEGYTLSPSSDHPLPQTTWRPAHGRWCRAWSQRLIGLGEKPQVGRP